MKDDISHLKETDIFKNLSTEQISKVLDICHTVAFSEDDIIMKEGDVGDRMYLIREGTVEVIKKLIMDGLDDDSAEKNKVFTRLDADMHPVFGEIALLEEMPRTATVRAITNCILLEITKNDFTKLAENNIELGYSILLNLARIVSSRLRKADEDTIKLATVLSMILKES